MKNMKEMKEMKKKFIVYLCEKPSQARDIAKVLGAQERHEFYIEGDNVRVTWCLGHLLEMAWPEYYNVNIKPWRFEKLPVVPSEWHLQPVVKTKKQLTAVEKLIKETDHVVIATDADREGEMIAREILDRIHFSGKIERLWLSALDEASIQKALTQLKPGHETEALYAAGRGRQRADWLIGLNMTMAATCLYQNGKGVLSVGRVQTPTLKLVVDRDRAIEQFKPIHYYVLLAQFTTEAQETFWTKWHVPEREGDSQGRCLQLSVIESFAAKIKEQSGTVEAFSESEKKQAPPLCLSLSALQKLASSQFGFSAKQTLDIAQALYETHKATTYPRTDCGYLPESQWKDAGEVLATLQQVDGQLQSLITQCNVDHKSPTWNDKKITAHHGIIPTLNKNVTLSKMSEAELKLYDLIRRYYIAQFLGNYIYFNRSVAVRCQGELFKASSNTPTVQGWKRVLQTMDEEETSDHLSTIPQLKNNQFVEQCKQQVETKQTQPPSRFTEGTLIDAMKSVSKYVTDESLRKILKETAGIGTEATRASILETLVKREYLTRKGKQLFSTEKGRALIDLLPSIVSDPALTAKWEQELDAVAQNTQKLDSFMVHQIESLKVMLNSLSLNKPIQTNIVPTQINHVVYSCPTCQKELRTLRSKTTGHFWACSGYPECRWTTSDHNGVPNFQIKAAERPNKNNSGSSKNISKTMTTQKGIS